MQEGVPSLPFLNLSGQPASDALPAVFLGLLVNGKVVPETHEIVAATGLAKALLPVTVFGLLLNRNGTYYLHFLDRAKSNRIPPILTPTSAFLRIAVFGGATKQAPN